MKKITHQERKQALNFFKEIAKPVSKQFTENKSAHKRISKKLATAN